GGGNGIADADGPVAVLERWRSDVPERCGRDNDDANGAERVSRTERTEVPSCVHELKRIGDDNGSDVDGELCADGDAQPLEPVGERGPEGNVSSRGQWEADADGTVADLDEWRSDVHEYRGGN